MENFNTDEYNLMISDLIHDTFYIKQSIRGKISGIRQFSEILVRKILNIGSNKKLMLGSIRRDFNDELNLLESDRKDTLLEIIERIRPLGNDSTHTQHVEAFSEDELHQVINGMFDLYAYMFIDHFLKYPMTILSPPMILRIFSLLPPIIRYKTLKYLYDREPNLQIANRYGLSIIKTYGKDEAYSWLSREREKLLSINYPTESEIAEYLLNVSEDSLHLKSFNNAYDLLESKISHPATSLNEKGKLYSTFEEAKKHYKENNVLTSKNIEEAERLFNNIRQKFSNNMEEVRD